MGCWNSGSPRWRAGVGALALSSGQAATTYSILTIAEAGDNVVSTSTLYGGTYNLFAHTLPQLGIETRFVGPNDLDAIASRIDERTKAVYCESIGNPAGQRRRSRGHRRGGPRPWRAGHHRQHGAHALPLPPLRARMRHRRPLDHEVHRRARHHHRRGHRRFRQVRLGRQQGALPPAQRTRRLLPRRGLHRGGGGARIHHPRPRGAVAQHRRRHLAAYRIPRPPGPRNAAVADGPHL